LRREVDRLRGILTDFLEYAGELRLDKVDADLNEVVEDLVNFFLPQAEKHGVRLRSDPTAAPVRVRVDVPRIKQALLNLMLNGVQAMANSPNTQPRELIVRVTFESERGRAGADTKPKSPPRPTIHVIDTGPGMSEETLAKMWQPYFTTKAGGTGLGLPTTRRIVDAHGGRIEVFSEVGKGTDFVLILPLEPAQ
jgi:signal transduction histidine kinase